jgi:hypothetical protein
MEADARDGKAHKMLTALPMVRRSHLGPLRATYTAEELAERLPAIAADLGDKELRPTSVRVAQELGIGDSTLRRLVGRYGLDWRSLVAVPGISNRGGPGR